MADAASALREMLSGRGAAWVGFADLAPVPAEARADLPRGLSLALALNPRIVAGIADGPTDEYYEEYRRLNAALNVLAEDAAGLLRGLGHRARPIPATLDVIDRATLWTALPHKTVATLAGLGWIGKCALLVSERFGSAIRMVSVLTDAPLPTGQPVQTSRCGDCTRCRDICPGGAPTGRLWHVGMTRGEFFDAFACCRAAAEQANARGFKHTICGRCIAACPWTKKYLARSNRPAQNG